MSAESPPPDAASSARGAALLASARREYGNGSLGRSWQACLDAAQIGRETGDASLIADAATVIIGPAVGAWSLTAQRHALAREAIDLLGGTDDDRSARLLAVLASTRNPWTADPAPVAGSPDRCDADRRSAELHTRHAAATGLFGLNDRLTCAVELAAVSRVAGRDEDAAWASLWLLDAYCQLGRRVELNAELMNLGAVVRRLASPVWEWRLATTRATVALLDGRTQDVGELQDLALRTGTAAGVEEAPYVDLVARSSLAVRSGSGLDVIEPRVRHAVADAPFFAHGWWARVLLSMGRTDEALAIWRALAPRLDELPTDSPEWLVATAGHAELCAAAHDTTSAEYLTEQLAPFAELHVCVGIRTPYEGPVSYYLGLLARTLGRHTTAHRHLNDALARSERMHAPVFAATVRAARDVADDPANPLTLRERDVAQLVARGLGNRRIAAELVLSERTVENHVSHILRKLGLTSRAGIAGRLSR